MAMKTVVALPGQGIGPEVVDTTCELLMGTGLPLKILTPPQDNPLPEETKRAVREADGVLFGAAGPSTSHVVSWLRWEMSAWAGVRPIRFYPGMRSPLADPEGIDYILLRENSEGIYPGREGDLADLVKVMPDLSDRTGRKVKDYGTVGRFAVKVVTPKGAERIARFAVELARKRKAQGKPGKITCVTNSNVMPRTRTGGQLRRRLGLLRIGPRLGPRYRGARHRQPYRDHSLGRPDAGAHGHGRRSAAARRCRGTRVPGGKMLTPDQGGTAKTREMAQAVLAAYRG